MIEPSGAAIKGLTKHIRETYRAFPLADLAKMILSGRDRYQVCFETTGEESALYQCKDDGSVWLTREEAIKHLLSSDLLSRYYEVEEVDVGAPAGNFSSIAVCGLSGEILGPPNHHEYQRNIARLHAERFSNMSLERYKSRIVMESGEEIVEKWKEKVSKRLQYRLKSAEEEADVEAEADAEGPSPGSDVDTEAPESDAGAAAPAEAETADVTETASGENVENDETDSGETPAGEVAAEPVSEEIPADPVAEPVGDVAEASPDDDAVSAEGGEDAEIAEGSSSTGEESPAEEPTAAKEEGPLLKSPEELARHFREHFAAEAVVESKRAVVRGDVPGRDLSRGLLVHLKQESEKLRRGFPLPLIQTLCRDFEKEGLRFFKRGKKALHVSAVRPRGINESVSLTGQVQAIIDQILKKPGMKVVDLLVELVDDFPKPEKDQAPETLALTDKAKAVLKDLRWLTSEGYVIEFPDTKLALGKQPKQGDQAPAAKKKAPAEKKSSPSPKAVKPEETPEISEDTEAKVEEAAADHKPAPAPEEPASAPEEVPPSPAPDEAAAPAEEAAPEEPVAEEPVVEEPVAEEAVAEEPVAEEPVAEEAPEEKTEG